jgi:Na+-driven multidrug efflux pump
LQWHADTRKKNGVETMLWGPISLLGFFCTVVFLGFALLSLFSIFTKKGSFLNSIIGLLLSSIFFAVFVFGAVKSQQYFEVAGDKLNSNAVNVLPKTQAPAQKK